MRTCALFPFSTAIHCYIGSFWLIFLFNSHSLLYANLCLFLLSNSHPLLYRIIVAYSPFQQPFIVISWLILLFNSHSLLYRIIVAYFPLEQPLIVIWDHCGLFSFRTAIHCYMRSCGLFSFSTAIHCYI